MRAGLPRREPDMLKEMQEKDLYHKLMQKNEGKPQVCPPRRPSLRQR